MTAVPRPAASEPGALARRGPASLDARPTEIVERASVDERRIYALEERLEEVELRLRERTEMLQQRELELRALERDVAVREGYAQRLELEVTAAREAGERRAAELQHLLDLTHNHARNLEAMIANHGAELAGAGAQVAAAEQQAAAAEQQAAELGALVGAMQSRAGYRLVAAAADRLQRGGPLFRLARRTLRGLSGG